MDQRSIKLEYRTTEDAAVQIPCRVEGGRVVRSLGLGGDELVVTVRVADWPLPAGPAGIDFRKPMALVCAVTGDNPQALRLEHYYLRQVDAAMIAAATATQAPGGTIDAKEVTLRLVTLPGYLRGDGRGALLQESVFNTLLSSGEVDDLDAAYRNNGQLVEMCCGALGFTVAAVPSSLNAFDPPGPLDWGNASAIDELDAVLIRVGHAISLPNTGTEFKVVELPRAGSAITLDAPVEAALARPLKVSDGPSLRSSTIVVTSGTTRTTVLTWRDRSDMEWVWYDPEAFAWKNATQTTSGTDPDDIAAFRAGPNPIDPESQQSYTRLFTALRLTGDDAGLVPVQAFQAMTFASGRKLAGVAAVAVGHAARVGADDQLEQVPAYSTDDPVNFGPCETHARAGVFVLPSGFVYVRGSLDNRSFIRAEAQALAVDGVRIYFAHEAAFVTTEGPSLPDYFLNYFVAAWSVTQPGGPGTALVYTELTGGDLVAAVNSTAVKIHDTRLRRIVRFEPGDTTPTELNLTALKAVALKLAKARASLDKSRGGVALLNGWISVRPGDCGGAAQRVEWDLDAFTTVLYLNEHEVPGAFLDEIGVSANYSLAAGIGPYFQSGAAATRVDVRNRPTPGTAEHLAAILKWPNSDGSRPEQRTSERGAEKTSPVADKVATTPGNGPAELPESIIARITGSTSIGSNRWSYDWEACAMNWTGVSAGTARAVTGAPDQGDLGPAYNLAEAMNDGSGIEGNGVDRANLPAGWAMQPVPIGSVVRLYLASTGTGGTAVAYFDRVNFDDGDCEALA